MMVKARKQESARDISARARLQSGPAMPHNGYCRQMPPFSRRLSHCRARGDGAQSTGDLAANNQNKGRPVHGSAKNDRADRRISATEESADRLDEKDDAT